MRWEESINQSLWCAPTNPPDVHQPISQMCTNQSPRCANLTTRRKTLPSLGSAISHCYKLFISRMEELTLDSFKEPEDLGGGEGHSSVPPDAGVDAGVWVFWVRGTESGILTYNLSQVWGISWRFEIDESWSRQQVDYCGYGWGCTGVQTIYYG